MKGTSIHHTSYLCTYINHVPSKVGKYVPSKVHKLYMYVQLYQLIYSYEGTERYN